MRYLSFLFLVLLIASCDKIDFNNNNDNEDITPPETVVLTKISIDKGHFRDGDGNIFFPWGFNYTNPEDVGLLDGNWHDESKWETIKSDFSEMRVLGANVVRIHLQYHEFMTDASTPNEEALLRLEDLVEVAKSNSVYLDITGLAAYKKSDQPSFYVELTDEERWHTQKVFWEAIAESVGDSPVVFAFNLMNEPVVSVGCEVGADCEWTPGDGFGGYHFVQNITRTPDNEFEGTMRSWISEMTAAIRSKDSNTLITVGSLSLGAIDRFSEDLDYLSPHIYPRSGEIQSSIDKILANQSNSQVVIEETSNLFCSAVELKEFIDAIDGKYNGLMGHYHGTPIAKLSSVVLKDALQRNFLEFFMDNNPNS